MSKYDVDWLRHGRRYFIALCRATILWIWLGSISCAGAQPAMDLAQANVPLAAGVVVDSNMNANNTSPAQRQLFQHALQQVLVKLTGNPGVMSLPAVRQQFPQAMAWVSSYRTVQRNLGGQDYNYLQVQFDAAGLRNGLRQAQQPVWPANRPATLVYLVLGHGENARLLTTDSAKPLLSLLNFAAQLRGIPIVIPPHAEPDIDLSILAQPRRSCLE